MTAASNGSRIAATPRAHFSLWLWDCDAHAARLLQLDQSADVLTHDERARAARLSDDLARQRWVCARIALRRALGAWTGTHIERRAFETTAAGRPYLPTPAPHFSLSHAGPFALAALCEAAGIGADIEQIAARKIATARRTRLEAFAQQLGGALPGEADARFIQAWCRIEAVAKAEGCGVGRLLTRAGLMGPGSGSAGEGRAKGGSAGITVAEEPDSFMRAMDLDVSRLAPGFAAAVAAPATVIGGVGSSLLIADGAALLTA